jgi:hypothetical protein
MGRPKYRSMGCEPGVIDGRPCDWPDCAASTNPSVVVLARLVSHRVEHRRQGDPMRSIGLDVHRDWRDVAIDEDGKFRSCGRVATTPDQLQLFAQSLAPDDRVALETTGNALSIARIIEPHVAGVLVADTRNVRAMTHAKGKNDRVEARMIAKLLAAGMLPGVWICDEATRVLRRRIARRRSWSVVARGRATRSTRG